MVLVMAITSASIEGGWWWLWWWTTTAKHLIPCWTTILSVLVLHHHRWRRRRLLRCWLKLVRRVISTSFRFRSVVPQATLLLGHVVRILAALSARFNAAPKTRAVCWTAAVRLGRFAFAVLEAAWIPADAHLQRTQARSPQAGYVVAARRSGQRKAVDGRFETRYGGSCEEGSYRIVVRKYVEGVGGVDQVYIESVFLNEIV